MRWPARGVIQRRCTCDSQTDEEECTACAGKRMQRRSSFQSHDVHRHSCDDMSGTTDAALSSPGHPLDPATRAIMETHLGRSFARTPVLAVHAPSTQGRLVLDRPGDPWERQARGIERDLARSEAAPARARSTGNGGLGVVGATPDLSRVRVYADARAATAARAVGADAFTVGSDIVFGAGRYAPGSSAGRQLLAHELTHVVQQGATPRAMQRLKAGEAGGGAGGGAEAPANGGLSDEMLQQIARRLHDAMSGPGTDEEAIYSSMAGRTQPQLDAIARVYQQNYGRELMSDLRDELTDSEMQHLGLFSPTGMGTGAATGTTLADMVARQLNRAMDRVGTDESAIFAALTGRTAAERQAIRTAYRNLTQRELEADLRDELSGSELIHAIRLLNQGMLQPEDEIYLAMAGWGTDEATIFRVLEALRGNNAGLQQLERDYRGKYGDLVNDLRDDLTLSEYRRAHAILSPAINDAGTEDCTTTQRNNLRTAHALAVRMLRNANTLSAATPPSPAVRTAARNHFRITLPATTPEATRLWSHVRTALSSMLRADVEAIYECEPSQSYWHGWCGSNNAAVTIDNIHICPVFWSTYTTAPDRAAVLIHEWGHRFGRGVALLFETYCFDQPAYGNLGASRLVRMPDAYMQYVRELHHGMAMPCI